MERFYNSKRQSMTNYLDIFKACRLCGSGGGYKMPIIQKLHRDDTIDVEAELKQKIKECVSIEVHPDDRMPPLICELCVDKVNDFYEFREMCRATNARVRASLGLPPQVMSQDVNEDCILGVSGPVFNTSKDNDINKKSKVKKVNDKKPLRSKEPSPPPILDRSTRRRPIESPVLSGPSKRLRYSSPASSSGSPIPEKKKPVKISESLAVEAKRLKASKAVEPKRGNLLQRQKEILSQKAKERETRAKEIAAKNKANQKAKEAQRAQELREKAKQAELKAKEAAQKKLAAIAAPTSTFRCKLCSQTFPKQTDVKDHVNFMHAPLYIDEKMACTPCKEWFITIKDAEAHHKWHKTSNTYYTCQRCSTDFKVLMGFTKHFQRKQCIPYETVPDVKCKVCQGMFATQNWMLQHKCPGPPKDMCKKCMSVFQNGMQLKRHERKCKGIIVPVNPDNPYLKEIRPLTVSIDRCDNLVRRIKTEPGLITSFKQEPMDFEESTLNIKQEIKQEMEDYNSDYGDYGEADDMRYSSDGSVSDHEAPQAPNLVFNPFARKSLTQVDTLSVISLRSIFGGKLLNKKTKRRKKKINPKVELQNSVGSPGHGQSAFDNLFDINNTSANERYHNTSQNSMIDNILESLRSPEQPDTTEEGQICGEETSHNVNGQQLLASDNANSEKEHHNEVSEPCSENSEVLPGVGDKETENSGFKDNTVPNLVVNSLTSHKEDIISDESGEESRKDVDDASNGETNTKSLTEFALDPEVEALLREDDNMNEDISNMFLESKENACVIKSAQAEVGAMVENHQDTTNTSAQDDCQKQSVPISDNTLSANILPSSPTAVTDSNEDNLNLIEIPLDQETIPNQLSSNQENESTSQDCLNSIQDNETPSQDCTNLIQNEEITSQDSSNLIQGKETPSQDNSIFTQEIETMSQDDSILIQENETTSQTQDHSISTHENEAPSQDHSISTQENEAPSQGHSISTQDNEAPSQGHSISTQENEAPSQNHSISTQGNEAPLQDHSISTQDNEAPSQDHSISTQDNEAPSQDHSILTQDNEAPSQDHSISTKDNESTFKNQHTTSVESNDIISSSQFGDGDKLNSEAVTLNANIDKKQSEDILDLISDSGDDCNIVDSPEKSKLVEDQLLYDNDKPSVDTVDSTNVSSENQLIDEESLLTGKDDHLIDTEITQQDEDLLLGKDDDIEAPSLETVPASGSLDEDLEKISDDEFDLD